MKLIAAAFVLVLSGSAFATWQSDSIDILNEYGAECRTAKVMIDEVVKNDHISGRVVGLPTLALEKFKVVLYVKSNKWYVHPYATGNDGYSYAKLNAKGEFRIRTVLRTPSKSLAAVVLPMPVQNYTQTRFLKPFLRIFGGATKYNCTWSTFAGNGDFLIGQ